MTFRIGLTLDRETWEVALLTNDEARAEFHRYFLEWMPHDLDAAIRGKANYVVALGLLSYVEVLGGMLTGRGGQTGSAETNFKAAINIFPQTYQDLDTKIRVSHPEWKKPDDGLYAVFRCGLAHEYSPKGLAVVVNDPSRTEEAHEGLRLEVDGSGRTYVTVYNNALLRDFRAAADGVYKRPQADEEPLMKDVKAVLDRLTKYTVSA